ncbi:unnamed protein product, partial [Mesorhabditis belari]|uniref:Uncharacterized protein n=1 Tax=Mesorhabditis belari TaxID=2138241 RepID=A0AAF3F0F9_9BILA
MFGRKMQLGFLDTIALSNAERSIDDNEQDVPDQEDAEIIDWSESIRGAITDNPTFFPETDDEEDAIAIAKEKEGDFVQRDKEIWHHRNEAALQQQKQAENMLENLKTDLVLLRSDKLFVCQSMQWTVRNRPFNALRCRHGRRPGILSNRHHQRYSTAKTDKESI